jgi:uncharacterized protein YdeI (YjbR/CyaY-like superfamily)
MSFGRPGRLRDMIDALPADLEAWLDDDALCFFDSLSHSRQRRYVEPIEQARMPEIRERRIAMAAQMLHEGRKR